jgi:hypothetical protein
MENPAKTLVETVLILTRGTSDGEGVSDANKARLKTTYQAIKARHEAGRFPAVTPDIVKAIVLMASADPPTRSKTLEPAKV